MVIRWGYVSNSSSAMFLVAWNSLIDFNEIDCGSFRYKWFMDDVKHKVNRKSDIISFCQHALDDMESNYMHASKKQFHVGVEDIGLHEGFRKLCREMNCDYDGAEPLATEMKRILDKDVRTEQDSKTLERIERIFCQMAYSTMTRRWRYISVFTYETDSPSYEFMFDFVFRKKGKFDCQCCCE